MEAAAGSQAPGRLGGIGGNLGQAQNSKKQFLNSSLLPKIVYRCKFPTCNAAARQICTIGIERKTLRRGKCTVKIRVPPNLGRGTAHATRSRMQSAAGWMQKAAGRPNGPARRPGGNYGQLAGLLLLGGCRPYGHCRLLTGAVRAIFGSGGVSSFFSLIQGPPRGEKGHA